MPTKRPLSPPLPASSEEIAMSSEDEDTSLLSLSASSDEIAMSSEDDDISLPSPFSSSPDASPEPYEWPSDESDGGATKKPRGPRRKRTWPSADEVALLEAVAAHKEQHGHLPSPADLVAALRGRLEVDAEQVAKRVSTLQGRFIKTTRQLSRGVVPVTDDDLKILRLSRRVWKTGMKRRESSASARHERRGFAELAGRYPSLAAEVEAIEARRGTDGMLKMAFGYIGDEKATELEAKTKKQNLAELKASMERSELKREVTRTLLEFIEG